ncbi:hypothetical protein SAMN05216199_1263 [Pedococcus cremeus]|uniref:Uncharacterized protein n=1 Tax=Pedococcus cremeus TaxID=587636 RepID=A0A1H9S6X6_9MICO|nr:hypothetical protein [Pedococcus cremeus]SER80113.1 hypothetical protein SAMN05216199_1263 [Pedococcus cremeus]
MAGASFFMAVPEDGRIHGGCGDCDAYQTLDTSEAPVYRLTVHHDTTCPAYRTREVE